MPKQVPEQLSMDFLSSDTVDSTPDNPLLNTNQYSSINSSEKNYEALDMQLAELLVRLNGEGSVKGNTQNNEVLKQSVLEISKHTREGKIAVACAIQDQGELLNTNVVGKAGDYKPLILDKGYLYLNRYFSYQHQLVTQIKARLSKDADEISEQKCDWAKQHLQKYFGKNNTKDKDYAKQNASKENQTDEPNWQEIAAALALVHKFLIVSGGPGTGKTTTITRILALLIEQHLEVNRKGENEEGNQQNKEQKLRILLAAPTGKAAIRMLDAINYEQQKLKLSAPVRELMPNHASTLHKLLGYQPGSVTFKHNASNTLSADVVLVDEASMVDIALLSKLLEAVPEHAKLILIGDKNQLSSVETGSVFADICGEQASKNNYSGTIVDYLLKTVGFTGDAVTETNDANGALQNHIVSLSKNWRFSDGSGISMLSRAINAGDAEKTLNVLNNESIHQCQLIVPQDLREIDLISAWQGYFEILKNPRAGISEIFEAYNQYRVLSALRRGLYGSTSLNERIEKLLAKKRLINVRNGATWYHGRPIMITQNSYNKGLYNGDTGIALKDEEGQIKVWFPSDTNSGFKAFAPVRLPAYETTWAMTIHKSQGSEFNQVTLILPHEVMPLLTRQLIYTGVTRAKQGVTIVSSEDILKAGVQIEVARATRVEELLSIKVKDNK